MAPKGRWARKGSNGNDGVSVSNVYDDGSGRCIIQLSNGATYGPFTVANGPQGAPGEVTTADLNTAIGGTSANTNAIGLLAYVPSDPPTAADWQALADKMNELIAALRR